METVGFLVLTSPDGTKTESKVAYTESEAKKMIEKLCRNAMKNTKGFRSAAKRANSPIVNVEFRPAL